MKIRYKKGEALTAETVNRLMAATLANTPRDGLGTRVVRGASGGFSIDITQAKGKGRASGASSHPWKGSLSTVEAVTTAATVTGLIYDSLHSITQVTTIITDKEVIANDWMCLELRISTGEVYEIENIVVQESAYEPFTESEGVVLTSVVPLYKVVDDDGKLVTEQVSRDNYRVVSACFNGTIIPTLAAS